MYLPILYCTYKYAVCITIRFKMRVDPEGFLSWKHCIHVDIIWLFLPFIIIYPRCNDLYLFKPIRPFYIIKRAYTIVPTRKRFVVTLWTLWLSQREPKYSAVRFHRRFIGPHMLLLFFFLSKYYNINNVRLQ